MAAFRIPSTARNGLTGALAVVLGLTGAAAGAGHAAAAGGRVTVKFALSHGASGSATWSDTIHIVDTSKAEFSGCALERDTTLHSTQLVVHVWPRTTAEFLTRDFKLTVSLSKSGAGVNSPTPPAVAMGYRGELYTEINPSPASKVTVRNGGRTGTFSIHNVINSSSSNASYWVTGSWRCTTMLHFTSCHGFKYCARTMDAPGEKVARRSPRAGV